MSEKSSMYSRPGRPRSPDQILMGIKAIIMEAKNDSRFRSPEVLNLLRRVMSCYGHGSDHAQRVYCKKIIEIEAELRKGLET